MGGGRWVVLVTALLACGEPRGPGSERDPRQQNQHQPAETCNPAWNPTFRQGTGANEWWVEVLISGGTVRAAWVQAGDRRIDLMLQWGKWVGRTTRLPRGTSVVVHAENDLGYRAQTFSFAYLDEAQPGTDACSGTCLPSCTDAVCGSDGCGGTCGSCTGGFGCEAGACVGVPGDCDGGGCDGGVNEPEPGCDGGGCDGGGTEPVPGCDGGSCDGGGTEPAPGCDGGSCDAGCAGRWAPQFQQVNANPWWIEYTVGPGAVTAVRLEVVGGGVTPLQLSWGKWSGRPSPSIPSGTQVVLHATDGTGFTASTPAFRYLVDTAPQATSCGGGGAPVDAGTVADAGTRADAGSPVSDGGCAPLTRGLVTIQFDDARSAQYTLARQPLRDHGMTASMFFITQRIAQRWTGYLTVAQAQALAADGHEIGSHTVSHKNLTQMTTAQIEDELRLSKQWLETNLNVPIRHFASPFGAYDSRVLSTARRHYQSHGTVETGLNFRGADLYRLRRYTVTDTMTPSQIRSLVTQARSSRGWLILLFHDFTTGTPGDAYTYRISDFEQVLDDVAASGLDVVTTEEGVARVRCQ